MGQFAHIERLEAGDDLNFHPDHRQYVDQLKAMGEAYGLAVTIRALPHKKGWNISAKPCPMRMAVPQSIREMAARRLELDFSMQHYGGAS
jgi:FAD synthase